MEHKKDQRKIKADEKRTTLLNARHLEFVEIGFRPYASRIMFLYVTGGINYRFIVLIVKNNDSFFILTLIS